MRYMTSEEIRESFLTFFERYGHKRLPSASLVPDDPQLMFTVAGMVPFKPIFWGKVEPVYTRVTTCQKCVRTNDIENVGRTPRHHTFFEMLGNFSFGDYFKREAIEWAWQFVTEVLGMPEQKLWVSVYVEDDEAFEIWRSIGVPERKIVKMGREDNFWGPAGPTGPCGPCSEIFYDTGVDVPTSNGEEPTPANTEGRFIEIWNLVFTEFYQDEEGKLHPLPKKNIDTGAGLERIAAMMQGVYWNFETDLFKPIINRICDVLNVEYRSDPSRDVSVRVIADHVRAVTFIIADGVLPSNEGRGYVLRRILRRALRHGVLLGAKEPFLYKIVSSVVDKMGPIYNELMAKSSFVESVVRNEELRFISNLRRGLELVQKITSLSGGRITGEDAFRLYDTYGFPIDILRDIARENGYELDEAGFERLLQGQRERSRKAHGEVEFAERTGYEDFELETVFVGYETLTSQSKVLKIKVGENFVEEAGDCECELVLDVTPFYAEKGGQVSDAGEIRGDDFKFTVLHVFSPFEGLIVHRGRLDGTVKVGSIAHAVVDERSRRATMRNHTATHLLHAALRKVLGSHVRQAGSLVEPSRLRFDFTHFKAMTPDEIRLVEELVNEQIMKALQVTVEVKSFDEAVKEGAIALFDEKYGEFVRVVKISDFSEELCGGTHVTNTGEIGLFKVTSESAISAGVRRIEAITGFGTLAYLRELENRYETLENILEASKREVVEKVERLIESKRSLEREVSNLKRKLLSAEILNAGVGEYNGVRYVSHVIEDVDADVMKELIDEVAERIKGVVLLVGRSGDKLSVLVKVPRELTNSYNAGTIARMVAQVLGGGGGGNPTFAQAGGRNVEKLAEALSLFEKLIRREV